MPLQMANNIPRSNSENFSICENEAIVYADEIRNDQVSKPPLI